MRRRTALMLAVVTALAVVGTALATMASGITVTTFVRATLGANKPDDALTLLQLNAEFNPNSAPTYGGMAQAYLKKNDKENAIKNFEKVIQIDPNNQLAKRQLEQLKSSK